MNTIKHWPNADEDNKKTIEEEIKKHTDRKNDYENMNRELEQSGEPQISTSDPESRQLMTRNNISEVAYNVQTVVDAKHYLPKGFRWNAAQSQGHFRNLKLYSSL
jgi:hypothetical protein